MRCRIGVGDIHLVISHDKPPLLEAYFNNLQSMLNQCKGINNER